MNLGGVSSDFGIKVVRFPYHVYSPTDQSGNSTLLQCGDIGITFAGTTVIPTMVKEAVAEILFKVQAIPGYSKYDLASIIQRIFRAFELIAGDASNRTNENVNAVMIVGGWCDSSKRHRIFSMDVKRGHLPQCREVLVNPGDIEIVGTGEKAAKKLLQAPITFKSIVNAIRSVIDDDLVPSVGGNIQMGDFDGNRFRLFGTAHLGEKDFHYWRGMLDLNSDLLTSDTDPISIFSLLNLDEL